MVKKTKEEIEKNVDKNEEARDIKKKKIDDNIPEKKEKKSTEKPKKEKKPTQKEFEKRVLDLANKGITSEKIGEQLRQEGIHSKEYNKKISKILKENKNYTNPDLKNMETKLNNIKKHFENNKQDKKALKEKERIYGKFRKLQQYFGLIKKKK